MKFFANETWNEIQKRLARFLDRIRHSRVTWRFPRRAWRWPCGRRRRTPSTAPPAAGEILRKPDAPSTATAAGVSLPWILRRRKLKKNDRLLKNLFSEREIYDKAIFSIPHRSHGNSVHLVELDVGASSYIHYYLTVTNRAFFSKISFRSSWPPKMWVQNEQRRRWPWKTVAPRFSRRIFSKTGIALRTGGHLRRSCRPPGTCAGGRLGTCCGCRGWRRSWARSSRRTAARWVSATWPAGRSPSTAANKHSSSIKKMHVNV